MYASSAGDSGNLFSDEDSWPAATLGEHGIPAGMLNVGRLDRDSEGLLLFTDDGAWCHKVLQGGDMMNLEASLDAETAQYELERILNSCQAKNRPLRPSRLWGPAETAAPTPTRPAPAGAARRRGRGRPSDRRGRGASAAGT